jgi:hypothetical protein
MTKQELDEIRKKLADEPRVGYVSADRFGNLITCTRENMAVTLLAEVDRLQNELAVAIQVSGELCDKCGWAMKFPSEPCRCELLQALTDIVNPQHNDKDICSIRCSRCYDPRQIAREALGEDN